MMCVIVMPQRCAEALQRLHRQYLKTMTAELVTDASFRNDLREALAQLDKGVAEGQNDQRRRTIAEIACDCEPCTGEHLNEGNLRE